MQVGVSKLSSKSNPPPITQILEAEEKLFFPQNLIPQKGSGEPRASSSRSSFVASKVGPGAFSRAWWLGQRRGSLLLLRVGVCLFLSLSAPSPPADCKRGPC